MELTYIFIVGTSLVILIAISAYALKNRNVAGSIAYLLQIILVSIWSIGSLLEMLSSTEENMLIWRNIEQIGVFLLPVACVYFAVDYARYDRLKKFLPLLLILPVIAIILIFTDGTTHIMRIGYSVSYSPLFGKALSVQQTDIGKAFVAYNYTLVVVALSILVVFSRQVARNLRRQVMLVFFAMGLVFVLAFFKTAFLEGTRVNLPIVTIYLPSAVILFYNLYKNKFFRVSPIARDTVFDVIEMGIVVSDSSGTITDMNPCAAKILDSDFGIHERPSGKKMAEVFEEFPNWVELTQTCATGELELKLTNSEPCFIHIRVYPLKSHRGTAVGSVTIMRDVTILRMQEVALKTKAETDSLTGLMNRDSFMESFARCLTESVRSGEHVSVLMMDLDKFKSINDSCGHDVGDRVLKAFADVLRDVLRHEDAIARIGGDEFEAVLPGVSRKEATIVANRILKAANSKIVQIGDETGIQLRLSIGVCDNETTNSEEEMLKYADKAMYIAKGKAGNCCVRWE